MSRARKIPKFDFTLLDGPRIKHPIVSLAVGGMHTLALTQAGQVYSWGCNDEGALGRTGIENSPELITGLKHRVNHISAGDSHSIAYNTETSKAFLWGLYRVRSSFISLLLCRIQLQGLYLRLLKNQWNSDKIDSRKEPKDIYLKLHLDVTTP